MGKIKKVPSVRHNATASKEITQFVSEATSVPLTQLPQKLAQFPAHWPYPRGDLYHWIPLLDRFDNILELFNREYGLDNGPQVQPFGRRLLERGDADEPATVAAGQEDLEAFSADGDRELLEEVLRFTRMLLERCGNRSLYASSGHVNHLLNTTSLTLLQATLQLCLRLAQRYQVAKYKHPNMHSQGSLMASHYNINLVHMHWLAMPLPKPDPRPAQPNSTSSKQKENKTTFEPNDLVALAKNDFSLADKEDLGAIGFKLQGPSSPSAKPHSPSAVEDERGPGTPTPVRRTTASSAQVTTPRPPSISRTSDSDSRATPASPRSSYFPAVTSKTYEISWSTIQNSPITDIVQDALAHSPSDKHYLALHFVRAAKAFNTPDDSVQLLLHIRLLAVANLAYVLNESKFYEKIGAADQDEPRRFHLAQQLCDLLQPSVDGSKLLSITGETIVLDTLEALAKVKHKTIEVVDALAVSVNHGILYYELRRAIASLKKKDDDENLSAADNLSLTQWRSAVFDLVTTMSQINNYMKCAEKMVNAGIIEILVEALTLRTRSAERTYEKIIGFLSSFVHGITTAFQALANAHGLETISELAHHQTELGLERAKNGQGMTELSKSKVVDYTIPYFQQATLRSTFKFIVYLFDHNAGVHDRLLRNLLDSPKTLGALRIIIANAHVFGSNVWDAAINTVSNFIHNEPTSFQVIAESGLARGILEAVTQHPIPESDDADAMTSETRSEEIAEVDGALQYPEPKGILPVSETICDVPTAFGAICLNEEGMRLFRASGALNAYFDIFLSPAHVRTLEEEGQTAFAVGNAFDELSRHHPDLKDEILEAVILMLKRVRSIARSPQNVASAQLWSELPAKTDELTDTTKSDDNGRAEFFNDLSSPAPALPFVTTCLKFLEGFFNNSSMCQKFCRSGGAMLVLDIVLSPAIPHDSTHPAAYSRAERVLHRMSQEKAHLVLPDVLARTFMALDVLRDFMDAEFTIPLIKHATNPSTVASISADEGRIFAQALVNVLLLSNVLSGIFAVAPFTGRDGNTSVPLGNLNFTDAYADILVRFGKLQTACTWDGLELSSQIPSAWKHFVDQDMHSPYSLGDCVTHHERGCLTCKFDSMPGVDDVLDDLNDSQRTEKILALKNLRTLYFLLDQVPRRITTFFSHFSSSLAPKRSSEKHQKQNSHYLAEKLVDVLIDAVSSRRSSTSSEAISELYTQHALRTAYSAMLKVGANAETLHSKQALTLILWKFHLAQGFVELDRQLTDLVDMCYGPYSADPQHLEAIQTSINTVLTLYSQVTASKVINDASQSFLIENDDPSSAEYFESRQFLVELRYTILNSIASLWRSADLSKLGTSNAKLVIEIVRNILKADGEERAVRADDGYTKRIAPTAADESFKMKNLNQELVSTYKPRLYAEAAYRCNNQETAVTEYCELAKQYHGPRFPTVFVDESTAKVPRRTEPLILGDGDHQIVVPPDPPSRSPSPQIGFEGHVWIYRAPANKVCHIVESNGPFITTDNLNEQRAVVRDDLVDRCLDVLSTEPTLTFELADLIQAAVSKSGEGANPRAEIGKTLVSSLLSLQGEVESEQNAKKVTGYAHLVALIVQDRDFFDSTLDELKEYFDSFVSWISLSPEQSVETAPWIEMVLLIIERVLAEDEQPASVEWIPPPADDPLKPLAEAQLPDPAISLDSKTELFGTLMDLLPKIGKNHSLALSVARVLVLLTRNRSLSRRFTDKLQMSRLFLVVRQLARPLGDKLQTAFMIILRHIVEDDAMIEQIMKTEIKTFFESSRSGSRAIDTTAYIHNLYHLILRDAKLFVKVTQELVEVSNYNGNPIRPQHLVLKKSSAAAQSTSSDRPNPEETQDDTAVQPAELSQPPTVESSDGVIHFLLRELSNFREVEDKPPQSKPPVNGSADPESNLPEPDDVEMGAEPNTAEIGLEASAQPDASQHGTFKAEENVIFIYRCFLMQCLAELLACYSRCKIDFINFSRKGDAVVSTPSKPRSGTINYLLNQLLPIGTLEHPDTVTHRKKVATSDWATTVVVALCSQTHEKPYFERHASRTPELKPEEPELAFVRRFVLEHALRSFKDAITASEDRDMRYSRMLALSDLFDRMLNTKQDRSNPVQTAIFARSALQIGRLMYEKNFVGVLTSSIADIELDFTNAKRAVKHILAPLKTLTGLAVDLSQRGELSSSTPGTNTEGEDISSATSVSDGEEDEEREQTPDLFRNSALSMFEASANNEESSDSEDDDHEDEDEEMYDDDFDGEMGYEDDNGETVSDDEVIEGLEGMHGLGDIEGLPGDVDMEVQIIHDGEEIDEDDENSDSDSEDEMDEDDEDDMSGHDHDDGAELDSNQSFIDGMEELEGEDDNASMADMEGVWEEGAEYGNVLAQDDDDDSPHGGPLEHLAHVLGVDDHSGHDTRIRVIRHDHDPESGEYFEDEIAGDDDEDENEDGEDEPDNDLAYEPEIEEDEDDDPPWDAALDNLARPYGGRWHNRPRAGGPDGFENLMSRVADLHSHVPTRFHARGSHPRVEDEGLNPLLQRSEPDGLPGRREGMSFLPTMGTHLLPGAHRRWHRDMAGGTLISDLMSAMNRNGLPANGLSRLSVTVEGSGRFLELDPTRPWRQQVGISVPGLSRPSSNHEARAVDFKPAFTAGRWEDEARILFGIRIRDKATRVLNTLFRVLLPQAMEAKRIKDAEEAVRRAAEEEAREEARKIEAERAEREAQEKKEKEEREAREAREAQALLAESANADNNTEMEGVEQTEHEVDGNAAPTEAPPAVDRIMTTIRGRQVDITDLGIDHEYLQALPEELREEVIMSQLTEQRSQAHQAGEAPQEISPEFLEALPPEIQQELLRQEAIERRRRERAESRRQNAESGNAQTAQAQEMDPADFLAMLDPNLRQQILIDAHEDEGYLNELPEELQREARILNERRAPGLVRRMIQATHPRIIDINSSNREAEQATERARPKQIVQMLDKAGVATLLRLMFVHLHHKAKTSLHAVLSDVCKNTQNRAEVISILLTILQDCTADVNAVEKSFAQLSLRAKQQAGAKTPQPLKRTPTSTDQPVTELSPLTIVQHCLGTLAALSADNPKVQTFFLSEHETAASQKAKSLKKGKTKDTKSSKYPLNALLTLLDRKLITENTGVMETLASLLSRVTLPLQILLKKAKEAQEAQEAEREAEAVQSSTAEQPTAEEPPVDPMEISMADVRMQEAPATTQAGESGQQDQSDAPTQQGENQDGKKKRSTRELEPPNVPEENIGLVVNILAARECPSKTFSDTLDIIKHMAAIPGAKEVFGRELIRQAQELGANVVTDLEALAEQISNAEGGADIQGMALARLSSAGSKQRKLLRILVALDHLFDPKRMQSSQAGDASIDAKLKDDILATLYESENFQNLWKTLSVCLTAIRQRNDMVNIATILLPLIESLMVVCRNSHLKDIPLNASQADVSVSTPPPEARMEGLFFTFTEEHRKILNELIRNNPKLMNGNLSILAKNSKVLEFDNKRSYFTRKIHNRGSESRSQHPALTLNVRRDQAFLDSYKALGYKSGNEIKNGKLNIRFNGEEGIDAGGVSREWFAVMARQMFNPDYALFNPVASDRTTFHPNSLSDVNKEHLSYFKFIGRIIGKALYEGRVLDCHFSRAVYRRILGKSVSLKDMETLDLEYYKSLVWMLENDITDIAFETFSVQVDRFGATEIVDLIENGRNVAVTEENKHDYVRLVVEHRLIKSVQDQLDAFLKGFHDIIPSDLISIFNEQELELLISGLPDIDVDDWKNNTEYHNFTATSAQIQWFWRAVKSFDPEERAKLLQFVTGTSKVPLNGFKELEGMNGFARFNIHRDYSSKDRLPTSHTCFNQLDLPEYESYEQLRQQLHFAITAGSEYFGFA